jgi:beta-glucanase (GH16 family)
LYGPLITALKKDLHFLNKHLRMIHLKSYFLPLITLLHVSAAKAQQASEYKLVWADEFNKNGAPDSSKWTYEKGFVRNQEFQWYQPQNARCENGKLIIEAKEAEKANPWYVANSKDWRKNRDSIHYTSACLITKGLHSWQYGRFILRARIPVSSGLWPAWWTLGLNKSWPANGEIDIMEYYRNKLLANIACLSNDNNAEWFSNRFNLDSLGGKNWASKFHIWKMDWNEKFIALYVDDRLLNKVPLDSLVNKDDSGFNPFKQPHYMLLNLAIGGTNGGDPSHTSFPQKFEIDYVRVYQKIR